MWGDWKITTSIEANLLRSTRKLAFTFAICHFSLFPSLHHCSKEVGDTTHGCILLLWEMVLKTTVTRWVHRWWKNAIQNLLLVQRVDMKINRTWGDGVPLLHKIVRNLVYTPCNQASEQVCFWNTHCTQHLYRGKKQTVSSVEGINPCSYHPSCAWEQNQKLIHNDWSVEDINPCNYHKSLHGNRTRNYSTIVKLPK